MNKRRPIRVLVVDDSAVVRQIVSAILSRHDDMEVVVAQEPLIALRKMKEALPDVILLDLEMPHMDGITFLRRIRSYAIPVVICSSFSGSNSQAAVRALEYGALDIVQKPELGLRDFLDESSVTLVELIRAAASARVGARSTRETDDTQRLRPVLETDAVLPKLRVLPTASSASMPIVAIGTSAGGTAALHKVLGAMPEDCPGMVIVQHMPAGFTAAFAQRLNETCKIEVREARDGDAVVPGCALIAAGNYHLMLARRAGGYCVQVRSGPTVSRHRPSVNVLFRSVARAAGAHAVGVLMTGMGDDGADGLLEMHQAGAATIAQDEATCVVYGMPKEAVARGAVDTVAPLPRIAQAILSAAQAR